MFRELKKKDKVWVKELASIKRSQNRRRKKQDEKENQKEAEDNKN